MFCAFCGVDKRTDQLERHCQSVHNEQAAALSPYEEVKMPEYENWEAYISKFPQVEGLKKFPAKVWRN